MTDLLSKTYMHFGNGGLMLRLIVKDGVLGIEAEHHQYGLGSVSGFIPLMYDEKQYGHHFDRSFTAGPVGNSSIGNPNVIPPARITPPKDPNDNSNNDVPIIWLHQQLNEIMDWFKKNPSKTLSDYQIMVKLKEGC